MTITYDLKTDNKYYENIKKLTDDIITESSTYFNIFLDDYLDNTTSTNEKTEAILELLLLGTYWESYISKAIILKKEEQVILSKVNKLKQTNPDIKRDIDLIKGHLNSLYLDIDTKENSNISLSKTNLLKLLDWLEATGEYKEELKHMSCIYNFLISKDEDTFQEIMQSIVSFTKYFIQKSKVMLGKYISNLNQYIKLNKCNHVNKEDLIFFIEPEQLYYINMLGAEIINRIFKDRFLKRERKAVLVPGCMKINQKTCQSKETRLGYQCQYCNNSCGIAQITKQGLKDNFEVYIISHESSALKNITDEDKKELGIIGVACLLNLISGGWKANKLGLPAQCVLLNNVGCHHWINKTYATNISINKLNEIIQVR